METTNFGRMPKLVIGALLLFFFNSSFAQQTISYPKSESSTSNKNPQVVEITSVAMNFDAPEEIPSGWTTFKYQNKSPDIHFFVMERMPEGKTIEDIKKEVGPVFQAAMDMITKGNPEKGFAEFTKLPEWYSQVVFTGGPGLVSPERTAETTFYLEPGRYVIECYVKMPNGIFHSSMGMVDEILVTKTNNSNQAPDCTSEIVVSGESGISFEDNIKEGPQVFRVIYADQKPHEHYLGHDLHLVKLSEKANLQALESWMNWANPEGFISPGPEEVEFLGGIQELPAGKEGYFRANLDSGKYAFISEVPNSNSKKLLKTFTVAGSD